MERLYKGNKAIEVDANGASGGLTLIWSPQEVNLNKFLVTRNSISASFHL